MRLLVLGASGGCGRWVVRLAGGRGHVVTAVARPASAAQVPDAATTTVLRDVLDPVALDDVLPGHDAVISCLGLRRRHPTNPWSALASPPDFASASAANLVAAMRRAAVTRIAAISAAGVADSAPALPAIMRWLIAHSTIGIMYADLARMEAVYRDSGLEWCAVRPVTLVEGPPRGRARQVDRYRLTAMISRGEVANWLLDRATGTTMPPDPTPMLGWR